MHIITHSDIERRACEAGISMRRICNRAGVSESTVVRWKYNRLSPRLIVVQKIVDALTALISEQQALSSCDGINISSDIPKTPLGAA